MSSNDTQYRGQSAVAQSSPEQESIRWEAPDIAGSDLLALLGDEYTRRILEPLLEAPKTGREIAEHSGVSKPTVYRRLDRLERAGVVNSRIAPGLDGHHCQRFSVRIDGLHIAFDADGYTVQFNSNRSDQQPGAPAPTS